MTDLPNDDMSPSDRILKFLASLPATQYQVMLETINRVLPFGGQAGDQAGDGTHGDRGDLDAVIDAIELEALRSVILVAIVDFVFAAPRPDTPTRARLEGLKTELQGRDDPVSEEMTRRLYALPFDLRQWEKAKKIGSASVSSNSVLRRSTSTS